MEQEKPSKTQKKREAEALQDLGVILTKTPKEKLVKLGLPTDLLEAVFLAQKITSNGALRRQHQYIGKIMRKMDCEAIKARLDYINGDSQLATKIFHLSEALRTDLLASDDALAKFLLEYSNPLNQELKLLIQQVRKEQSLGANRNYTKLFRMIKTILEEKEL